MRSARGFTLIELLVVLAIMAFVVVIAAPYMASALPHWELKSAAREVAAALRDARSRAILTNSETVFNLDVRGHFYSVTGDARAHALPPKLGISLYTASQEQDGVSNGNIRFFPDGSSTGGRVGLSDAKASYIVTINWLTGRVELVQ